MYEPSKKGEELYRVSLRATSISPENGAAGAKYIEEDVRENRPWLENPACWYDAKEHALFFRAEHFANSDDGMMLCDDFENFILGFFGTGNWQVDVVSVKKIRRE